MIINMRAATDTYHCGITRLASNIMSKQTYSSNTYRRGNLDSFLEDADKWIIITKKYDTLNIFHHKRELPIFLN